MPAALLIGLAKSGLLSGIGALAVPLMALAIPVPQAAAICLPILAASDVMGVANLFRHARWNLLKLLLPAGLAGIALGALSFGWLSVPVVTFLVGVITLVFWAIRRFVRMPKSAPGTGQDAGLAVHAPAPAPAKGAVLGVLTGFTSFMAHAGSPPVHFYALPLGLPPLAFSATMSVLFTVLNFSKWLPFAALGLIDARNMSTSVLLLPVALAGTWFGLKAVGKISTAGFNRLLLWGMLVVGCKLLWDGARGLLTT